MNNKLEIAGTQNKKENNASIFKKGCVRRDLPVLSRSAVVGNLERRPILPECRVLFVLTFFSGGRLKEKGCATTGGQVTFSQC